MCSVVSTTMGALTLMENGGGGHVCRRILFHHRDGGVELCVRYTQVREVRIEQR